MTTPRHQASMTVAGALNFAVTNRLPRRLATRIVGRLSRIEHPLVARAAIGVWRMFFRVDLADAAETRFPSMHACFTRALKADARPFATEPAVLASPSDAIVGACGAIDGDMLMQVKGMPYTLAELAGADGPPFARGTYATLRLTAGMYHRFHAPADATVTAVRHIWGDTWNVNPPALARIDKLFCRNERAVIRLRLADGGWPLLLVPVAAILVAGIRLSFLDTDRLLRDAGERPLPIAKPVGRGDEMGWFEHGSTIIVIAPPGFALAEGIAPGKRIRAGVPLMVMPQSSDD